MPGALLPNNMDMRLAVVCIGLVALLGEIGCGSPERHNLKKPATPQPLAFYQRAYEQNPADPEVLLALGWLYLQKDRTRHAVDVLSELVAVAPDDADVHYYLGVALAKEHRKSEAIAAFHRALEKAPAFVEVYWALALLYNERGDGYEKALATVEEGLQLAGQSGYGHFVLGFVLCSRGDNENAKTALLKAIELDPDLAHAHYYLALIYLRLQDDPQAMAAMEQTIAADPGYTSAYYSLGTLYARTGRDAEGARMIELFQQLSSATMDEDHYRRLLYRQAVPLVVDKQVATHFNLGLVYLRRKELAAALEQFEAALALDSTYAEASHNIGVIYSLQEQHAAARPFLLHAVRHKPDYALAFENIGNNSLVLGEYAAAVAAFRRALALDGSMASALDGLGTALIQQGHVAEGRAARAEAAALRAQQ